MMLLHAKARTRGGERQSMTHVPQAVRASPLAPTRDAFWPHSFELSHRYRLAIIHPHHTHTLTAHARTPWTRL